MCREKRNGVENLTGKGLLSPKNKEEDKGFSSLRPGSFSEYIGQVGVKEKVKIGVEAAKLRDEPLDHILLIGPPGLGKTTLANILANEMGVSIHISSGPIIERAGDLAAILTSLERGDVFFIDEIHRLNRTIEEVLYPAMEDYEIDIMLGKGPSARSIRVNIQPFTLIGATTRSGLLTSPLRNRFGMTLELQFYSTDELVIIVKRASHMLNIKISDEGAFEIAKRSRGTPRVANRLLRRIRDYAQVRAEGEITLKCAKEALALLGIDELGLDEMDRKILKTMIERYGGGPVGINTLAFSLGEEPDTISDVYEPYLLQQGLIQRTPRGRIVTDIAYAHVGDMDFYSRQEKLL